MSNKLTPDKITEIVNHDINAIDDSLSAALNYINRYFMSGSTTDIINYNNEIKYIREKILNLLERGTNSTEYITLSNYLLSKDNKSLKKFISTYSLYGKRQFIEIITNKYACYNSFFIYEWFLAEPTHKEVIDLMDVGGISIERRELPIFGKIVTEWLKRNIRQTEKTSRNYTDVLTRALQRSFRDKGNTSLKSVWDFFSSYNIDNPYKIEDYEIYLETKDEDGNTNDLENQALIIANDKDDFLKKIKYLSLYVSIKKAAKNF
ncbi:MAG: hypothetical protein JZU65_02515 [Chlorobium sp.]|jgi:hypothetical protein|nr:hypothetical protein [Chlorobium sp.]